MGIKNGLRYDFSMMYRLPAAGCNGLELVSSTGKVLGRDAGACTTGTGMEEGGYHLHSTDTS